MLNKISFSKIFLFLLPAILFLGCDDSSNINDNDTIYGSGNIVTQTRNVDECSGLVIKNVGNVYLTQDANQSIRVEADDNIIEKIETYEENGTLIVGLENGSYSDITVKIYVSLKDICKLSVDGAGNIEAANDIECDTINCTISGAGNLLLSGSGNYFDCAVNGVGNISAKDFITGKCRAFVNGAGNVTINVTEELDATVNGVGTITYYGNPPVLRTSVTGIGQIIRK